MQIESSRFFKALGKSLEYNSKVALFDTAYFKKMNILFEWIFCILKKMNIFLNEHSGLLESRLTDAIVLLDYCDYLYYLYYLDYPDYPNYFGYLENPKSIYHWVTDNLKSRI